MNPNQSLHKIEMSERKEIQIKDEINWQKIDIPQEIEDLEVYLNNDRLEQLSEEMRKKYQPFVIDLVNSVDASWTITDLQTKMKELRRCYRVNPKNSHLIEVYRYLRITNSISENPFFERIIRKKFNRSSSGVVVITTLLGPGQFSCPMDCKYCPNDPAIARSYLLNEPAVRRGFKNGWDAIRQFFDCANRLDKNGHIVTKVEIIIEGGTFGSYPHDYIDEYFRDLYYAANIWGDTTQESETIQVPSSDLSHGVPRNPNHGAPMNSSVRQP